MAGLFRQAHGRDIARLTGRGRVVVEFGSGSSAKTPLLLREDEPAASPPRRAEGRRARDTARLLDQRA